MTNENGVSLNQDDGEVARISSDLEAAKAMLKNVLVIIGKVKKNSKIQVSGQHYNALYGALLTIDGGGKSTRELDDSADVDLLYFDVLQAAAKSLTQAVNEFDTVLKGVLFGTVLKQDGPKLLTEKGTAAFACASIDGSKEKPQKWITIQPEYFLGQKPLHNDKTRALTLIHEVIHLAGGGHMKGSASAFSRATGADTLELFVAILLGIKDVTPAK